MQGLCGASRWGLRTPWNQSGENKGVRAVITLKGVRAVITIKDAQGDWLSAGSVQALQSFEPSCVISLTPPPLPCTTVYADLVRAVVTIGNAQGAWMSAVGGVGSSIVGTRIMCNVHP